MNAHEWEIYGTRAYGKYPVIPEKLRKYLETNCFSSDAEAIAETQNHTRRFFSVADLECS